MSLNWGPPAHNYVPEYQQSGIPYVTSSATNEVYGVDPIRIEFPYVTRWIVVHNKNKTQTDTIRFGFTSNGVKGVGGRRYFELDGAESSMRLEVKCTELWFLADDNSKPCGFSVVAGLTNVPVDNFFAVTGSNGVSGVG